MRNRAEREKKRIIDNLNQNTAFVKALDSEVGRELLEEVKDNIVKSVQKIMSMEHDEKDLIAYQVWREIGDAWAAKIESFEKNRQDYEQYKS
jgi:hypothetical protein